MKSILFTILAFSLSANAGLETQYSYSCEKYTKSYKKDFEKAEDTFTLKTGVKTGFLGFVDATWMSLENDRVKEYMRFGIDKCIDEHNEAFLIDDRCAELYDYQDFGYFTEAGKGTDDGPWNGLPTWVNSNLSMSLSALSGGATAVVSTAEYGGEEPNGDVRVFESEWRCELQP